MALLPYLIFKNHGSLVLDNLKAEIKSTEKDAVLDTLKQVLMEYATALTFDGTDFHLWRRVAELASRLQLSRVHRYALDIEIGEKDNFVADHSHGLLWNTDTRYDCHILKRRLAKVIDDIHDRYSSERLSLLCTTEAGDVTVDEHEASELDWLGPERRNETLMTSNKFTVETLTIRPANRSWYALTRALIEKHRVSQHRGSFRPIHFAIDIPALSTSNQSESESADSDMDSTLEYAIDELRSVQGAKPSSENTDSVHRDDGSNPDLSKEPEYTENPVHGTHLVVLEGKSSVTEPTTRRAQWCDTSANVQAMTSHTQPSVQVADEQNNGEDTFRSVTTPDGDQGAEPNLIMSTTEAGDQEVYESIGEHVENSALQSPVPSSTVEEENSVASEDPGNDQALSRRDSAIQTDVDVASELEDGEPDSDIHEDSFHSDVDLDETARPGNTIGTSDTDQAQNELKRAVDMVDSDGEDETSTRASKRVKQKADQSGEQESNSFHNTLASLFGPLGITLQAYLDLNTSTVAQLDSASTFSSACNDFRQLLFHDWDDDTFATVSQPSAKSSLTTAISRTMSLEYPEIPYPKKDPDASSLDLQDFANRIGNGLSYFRCVYVEILLTLLGSSTHSGKSSYLGATWSMNFRNLILKIAKSEEKLLLDRVSVLSSDSYSDRVNTVNVLVWSQALFELFVDDLVDSERQRLSTDPSAGTDSDRHDRAQRWQHQISQVLGLLSDTTVLPHSGILRFQWASTALAQAIGCSIEETLQCYTELAANIRATDDEYQISLPNCRTMNMVSVRAVELEIAKFSTMDFFDDVFKAKRESDYKGVIKLLQPVLIVDHRIVTEEIILIERYFARSPLEFRLQLWQMLAEATSGEKRHQDALLCSLESMNLVLDSLYESHQNLSTASNRQTDIVQAVDRLHNLLTGAYHDLQKCEQKEAAFTGWSLSRSKASLQMFFNYLVLLQVFVQYEDSTANDESATRQTWCFPLFRDNTRNDLVKCWIIIYHLYKHCLTVQNLNPDIVGHKLAVLINVLHDELGERGYCQLLEGSLLELFENEIFRLDRAEAETDLIQVLHCRYGLAYQVGPFVAWDHRAEPQELSIDNALRILPFVLTFVHEKSPGIWLPKADVRLVLERMHKILWPVIEAQKSIRRDRAIIERFLKQDISPQDLHQSLLGRLSIPCSSVKCSKDIAPKSWSALHNLSLVLGRIFYSMCRSRNKNKNKGVADLETARKFYLLDLEINAGRVESWHAIGSISAALADSELGFDAQHIWKERDAIGNMQRETILCYMMATSLSLDSWRTIGLENRDHLFEDLLYEFGFQLYNAAREPFAMSCFKRREIRYIEHGDGRPEISPFPTVTLREVLKLAGRCLSSASHKCSDQWRCHLMLGKIHEKLKLNPIIALNDYKIAIQKAPLHSTAEQGLLLDPHYRLISSLYKYLLRDQLPPALAFEYLQDTSFHKDNSEGVCRTTKDSAISAIQAALEGICSADKKHWHHRPVHRLAVLLQNLSSTQNGELEPSDDHESAARTRIESLFTAKGSGGNLLNIWKPEFERPGRHYHYTNRYTNYYIDLLFAQGDMENIRNFMRRVRKATSSVLHHREIWHRLCETFFNLSIANAKIPKVDTAEFVDVVDSATFSLLAAKLDSEASAGSLIDSPVVAVLRDFCDIRKLNAGLYDTNKIDDDIINCYLVLYLQMNETQDKNTQNSIHDGDSLPAVTDDVEMSNDLIAGAQISESDRAPNDIAAHTTQPMESDTTMHDATLTIASVNDQDAVLPVPQIMKDSATGPTSAAQPVTATKPRGRAKEPKMTKVSRRDILTRVFALTKPKMASTESGRGGRSESVRIRGRADSSTTTTMQPAHDEDNTMGDDDALLPPRTTVTATATEAGEGMVDHSTAPAGIEDGLVQSQVQRTDLQDEDEAGEPDAPPEQSAGPIAMDTSGHGSDSITMEATEPTHGRRPPSV